MYAWLPTSSSASHESDESTHSTNEIIRIMIIESCYTWLHKQCSLIVQWYLFKNLVLCLSAKNNKHVFVVNQLIVWMINEKLAGHLTLTCHFSYKQTTLCFTVAVWWLCTELDWFPLLKSWKNSEEQTSSRNCDCLKKKKPWMILIGNYVNAW